MRRVLPALLLFALLTGCASTPRYASDGDYYYDTPAPDLVLMPDYFAYSAYYNALWPTYHGWWNPFYAPGFLYGVTFFPRSYFGWDAGWPYYAYSPWWGGYWDRHHDWAYWQQRYPGVYAHRYGSAQNEAIAAAQLTQRRYSAHESSAVRGWTGPTAPVTDPTHSRAAGARFAPSQIGSRRPAHDAYYGAPRAERGPIATAGRMPKARLHSRGPMPSAELGPALGGRHGNNRATAPTPRFSEPLPLSLRAGSTSTTRKAAAPRSRHER